MNDTTRTLANSIIGQLLTLDKYRFTNQQLVADVVRETVRAVNTALCGELERASIDAGVEARDADEPEARR
jgi:hypothetical protein